MVMQTPTQTAAPIDAATAAKLMKRCADVAMAAGWLHPFFMVPLAYVEWVPTREIPTMGVLDAPVQGGRKAIVKINPDFAATLPDRTLAGCIFHEVLHPMLAHAHRMGSRDFKLWNIAADMAINSMLRKIGLPLPEGVFYAPYGQEEASAEELYTLIAQNPQMAQGADPGQVGKGCGAEKVQAAPGGQEKGEGDQDAEGDGNGPQGEGEGQGGGAGDSGGDEFWGEINAQAQAMGRGTTSGQAFCKTLAPAPVKVRWAQVLRSTINRVAASGGRDMQSFSRRGRRSPPGIILPGWKSHRPTVCVVIDTSGSVSDKMLAEAIGNTVEIAETSGARIFLVLHDTIAYWHDWIDARRPEKINRLAGRRGGTDATEAYQVVGKTRAHFDALVHLTDGELGHWPARPNNARRLVAAILGGDGRYMTTPPAGTLVVKASV